MSEDRHQRAETLFYAARDLDAEARAALLLEQCGGDDALRADVQSLLQHHDADAAFMATPAAGSDLGALLESEAQQATEPDLPDRIGQFKILGVLGRGGMGIVYLAQQDVPRRRVALKVIRQGIASREILKRFEYECQILGALQHPGIAQIFEAGVADTPHGSQRYFAMERVDGATLTEYARQHALNTRRRLELISTICDAVQHAHQKGVVHRDLKPANILVDSAGRPKILDFGVARATDADIRATTLKTETGQLIGTIAYMSPEQIGGRSQDIDTRSDVYALGVLCFELLTGRMPHDVSEKSIPAAARLIDEEDPLRLSVIDRAYRGDVDLIVAKALEKDKERRYASAGDLAEDIRRHLGDQPIAAKPTTFLYQVRKFSKRNKAFVAATAVTIAALASGLGMATVGFLRARDEAAHANAALGFIEDMITAVDPDEDGRNIKVLDLLKDAAPEIQVTFAEQPETQTALLHMIGRIYWRLGVYDQAEVPLRQAWTLLQSRSTTITPNAVSVSMTLIDTLTALGQHTEAEKLCREQLAASETRFGHKAPASLSLRHTLGKVLHEQSKFAEAEALFRLVMETREEVLGQDHRDTLASTQALASNLVAQQKLPGAEALLSRVAGVQERTLGRNHTSTLQTLDTLADCLGEQRRLAEAEVVFADVLARRAEVLGEDHDLTVNSRSNLANALASQGKFEAAEKHLREVLDYRRRTLPADHPTVLQTTSLMAMMLRKAERCEEALEYYRPALEGCMASLGADHFGTLTVSRGLGGCLTTLGDHAAAEAHLVRSFEGYRRMFGVDNRRTQLALSDLITLYGAWQKPDLVSKFEAFRIAQPAPTSSPGGQ